MGPSLVYKCFFHGKGVIALSHSENCIKVAWGDWIEHCWREKGIPTLDRSVQSISFNETLEGVVYAHILQKQTNSLKIKYNYYNLLFGRNRIISQISI